MEHYTTHIKSKNGWFDIDLRELWQYRDLTWLFFKRNYITRYKQTILGPLWLILNPLITVMLYSFVFGGLANLSTDDVPHLVFYLCSNAIWSFFAACLDPDFHYIYSKFGDPGQGLFPQTGDACLLRADRNAGPGNPAGYSCSGNGVLCPCRIPFFNWTDAADGACTYCADWYSWAGLRHYNCLPDDQNTGIWQCW